MLVGDILNRPGFLLFLADTGSYPASPTDTADYLPLQPPAPRFGSTAEILLFFLLFDCNIFYELIAGTVPSSGIKSAGYSAELWRMCNHNTRTSNGLNNSVRLCTAISCLLHCVTVPSPRRRHTMYCTTKFWHEVFLWCCLMRPL